MGKRRSPTPGPQHSALSKLVACGKLFCGRQWMWGTAGNLSVKLRQEPLEIAVTPSGVNKGHLTTRDLIVVDDNGVRPHGKRGLTPLTPSSETIIHRTLHRALEDCGAVFHVHPIYATLISSLDGHPKERRMLHIDWFEMMKGLGIGEEESAEVPIFPNWQDVSRIARDIEDYLRTVTRPLPVMLIYNHGLTGWGKTADAARNHLEIMEYTCQYLYLKRLSVTR